MNLLKEQKQYKYINIISQYYNKYQKLIFVSFNFFQILQFLSAFGIYTYPKFTARLHYTSPWYNVTQYSDVAFDQENQRIRYAYQNDSNKLCVETVAIENDFTYIRTINRWATKKTEYQCLHYQQPFEQSQVAFVPDLTDFIHQGETTIHNQKVQHYRMYDQYKSEDNNKNKNYTSLFDVQHDFYCKLNENGTCTPLKWRQFSRNNFDAHTDIYEIEYDQFSFGVTDQDFEVQMIEDPYNSQCEDLLTSEEIERKGFDLQKVGLSHFKKSDKSELSQTVKDNLAKLEKYRENKNFTFSVGVHPFMDMTFETFKRLRTGRTGLKTIADLREQNADIYYLNTPYSEDLPKNFDLRYELGGVITPVGDQQYCGSCWAWSAAGAIETSINTLIRQETGEQPLVQLSAQAIVDCYWVFSKEDVSTTGTFYGGSNGCEGGSNTQAMKDFVGSNYFWSSHNYPYIGQDDYCKNDTLADVTGYRVKAFHLVPRGNVDEMKRALMHTAVSVGISVPESLLFYTGGVYNDPECSNRYLAIGHAVLAVGWAETEYGQAWIIKNSWSNVWGQDGYIAISMENNLCAVLDEASWVEMEKIN